MSTRNLLKKILPAKVKARLKMGVEIFHYSLLMRKLECGHQAVDYMLGTPIHTNLGDHLITLAQREFLDANGYGRKIIEIPTEMFQVYKNRIKSTVNVETRIFINGGGWMGNIWPNEELLLQEMVECFADNKIVIFPQTIYYDKNVCSYNELIESGKTIFSKCKDLTLCVRDKQSLEFAKQNYPTAKVLFLPDIALAYYNKSPKNRRSKEKIVGYCLRDDRELCRDKTMEERLKQILDSHGFKAKKVSTMSLIRVPSWLRERVVVKRLSVFSECNLIVTDRLHGMIFSFLTGTPCIVFDNKTFKVSGVYYAWLNACDYILPGFSNLEEVEIEKFIQNKLNGVNGEKNSFEEEFGALREEIH